MNRIALLASVLLLAVSPGSRANYDPPDPAAPSELAQASKFIENKNWTGAVATLIPFTRANPGNADGYNLLGYSYRHLKRYDESLAAYNRALTLDPKHRGAHEYIGEAYIQLGQLDKARVHLDALDRICTFSCQEYRDLKKAYEAARLTRGN